MLLAHLGDNDATVGPCPLPLQNKKEKKKEQEKPEEGGQKLQYLNMTSTRLKT